MFGMILYVLVFWINLVYPKSKIMGLRVMDISNNHKHHEHPGFRYFKPLKLDLALRGGEYYYFHSGIPSSKYFQ